MTVPLAEQLPQLLAEIAEESPRAPAAIDPRVAGQRLATYVALIREYGQRINLVGCRERGFLETDLVMGSLQLLRTGLPSGRLVDVGSGAGIPGIPLAIVLPSLDVTLVEVRKKRAAFLDRARHELGLSNVRVLEEDVERLHTEPFDWAISRAFRPPARWLKLAPGLVRRGGSVGLYAKRRAWAVVHLPDDFVVRAESEDATDPERVVVRLERV